MVATFAWNKASVTNFKQQLIVKDMPPLHFIHPFLVDNHSYQFCTKRLTKLQPSPQANKYKISLSKSNSHFT